MRGVALGASVAAHFGTPAARKPASQRGQGALAPKRPVSPHVRHRGLAERGREGRRDEGAGFKRCARGAGLGA